MSSITESILGSKSYGRGVRAPMLDPAKGGQFGFAPNYRGILAQTPYVRRNLIAILIKHPTGFDVLPDSEYLVGTLKALVELHALRIEGLQNRVDYEYGSVPFGGAGEMLEVATNATRPRSDISFTWNELDGRPIGRFLQYWGNMLIMDPELKHPAISTLGLASLPDEYSPEFSSMTVLFLEPDVTHKRVVTSWLSTNMQPMNSGDWTGSKDKTSAGQTVELNIQMTNLTQRGLGVDAFAQRIFDMMNLTGSNPLNRNAFVDDISADVKKAESGYSERIAEAARDSTQI